MTLASLLIHTIFVFIFLFIKFCSGSGVVTMTVSTCVRDYGTEEDCYFNDDLLPERADHFRAKCDREPLFAGQLCCVSCMAAFSLPQYGFTTPIYLFERDPSIPLTSVECPPRNAHGGSLWLGHSPGYRDCRLFAKGQGNLRTRTAAGKIERISHCNDLQKSTHPISKYWLKACATECGLCQGLSRG